MDTKDPRALVLEMVAQSDINTVTRQLFAAGLSHHTAFKLAKDAYPHRIGPSVSALVLKAYRAFKRASA